MELGSNCTVFIAGGKGDAPSAADIQKKLESPHDELKAEGMQELITGLVQGERYERLLMPVIRFCIPCSNNRVKKLVLLYLEVVDKCDAQGKLKEEIILICNALRNDLTSPNEFVRGSALRLVAKIRQQKVVEPLLEAIIKNLTHRHSYVRRNAVLCVLALIRHFGLEFVPHALEQVDQLLLMEGDASTRRAAFLLLLHCDTKRALLYIQQQQQQQGADGDEAALLAMGEQMQLAILELVRKVCRLKLPAKAALLRVAVSLLNSASPSVAYEGASCVLAFNPSSAGVRAACGALTHLLLQQTENNIKLIMLDRIADCVTAAKKGNLCDYVVDLMRGLQTNSLEVRGRILSLVGRLVSAETAPQVVGILKKHIAKAGEAEALTTPGSSEYRAMLVQALSRCCEIHPQVMSSSLGCISDLLGDADARVATSAAQLLRRLAATELSLRDSIIRHIVDAIMDARHPKVLRICIWTLGECCLALDATVSIINAIYDALVPLPLDTATAPEDLAATPAGMQQQPQVQTRTVILADGSYGTESVVQEDTDTSGKRTSTLREAIVGGDALLAAVVSICLTKLLLLSSPEYFARRRQQRLAAAAVTPAGSGNRGGEGKENLCVSEDCLRIPPRCINQSLLVVSSLFKCVRSVSGQTSDAAIRCNQALRTILCLIKDAIRGGGKEGDGGKRGGARRGGAQGEQRREKGDVVARGLVLNGARLLPQGGARDKDSLRNCFVWFERGREQQLEALTASKGGQSGEQDAEAADVAVGEKSPLSEASLFHQRLRSVQQLTGLADEVYVEAFLRLNQFDLLLELLVVNRTNETLYNVNVELAAQDRPAALTLPPFASVCCFSSLKLKSAEGAVLFGVVSLERKGSQHSGRQYILLAELSLDCLPFVHPTWIEPSEFRRRWQEFEWENKLQVLTPPTDLLLALVDDAALSQTELHATEGEAGTACLWVFLFAGGVVKEREQESKTRSLCSFKGGSSGISVHALYATQEKTHWRI
ncbi:adaptin n terminal region family [Cyclospora cayetanensis]|uniref:Coatomer subunit beta n=1 Tax=Cyclospora cayetanensis TaxID=88456 RepID=A0A1D3CU09_9EIME|nr:adaptin n terminal region family [Cyclospora cayetanensis]